MTIQEYKGHLDHYMSVLEDAGATADELYGLPPVDNADLVASSIASDVMSLISMENRAYLNLGMEVEEK